MGLHELQVDDFATITHIDCDKALKNRFHSFGVVKGAKIRIENITLAKSTMEISINRTKIALRLSEARKIKVEHAI